MRRSDPDFVLLGASSRLGLPAELLIMRFGEEILFNTFVRHDGVVARAVWAGTEPLHRPIVRYVLGSAARRQTRPSGVRSHCPGRQDPTSCDATAAGIEHRRFTTKQ
jgi:hypothetical protein